MKDYLGLHLRDVPYFRALLRAVEARFYDGIDLPEPVLDLGCGDGHFASLTFETPLSVGIDPWWRPLQDAGKRNSYQHLACCEGARLPFPSGYFSSVISNSVLEHIPDLDPVLAETARVLKPGSPFIFCVPNHRFLETLSIGRTLDKIGHVRLGNRYRDFFNRISRHYHCDSIEGWKVRLENHGFQVIKWWDYFPPKALHTLEWGHYFGLASWVSKMLFNKWILVPADWNLALTRSLVQDHYNRSPLSEEGVYTFYVAKWVG